MWRGRTVAAWLPERLARRNLTLTQATTRWAREATDSASQADAVLPGQWQPLADLMRRGEGIASSAIEEVRAPLAEVAMAETQHSAHGPAGRVVANLEAVRVAVSAAAVRRLTVASLHGWHRVLMRGATHVDSRHIGAPRDVQGWIGGTSPLDAALVTPPPEHLGALLVDLVEFCNRDDIDPVVQAALAHAQFETVHPYADGNGRIGRVLISWVLVRRLTLRSPPPVSVGIASDVGGYLSGLALFRLARLDLWVRWFADAVRGAAQAVRGLVGDVEALRSVWSQRLAGVRSDATAWRVLALLPARPALTAAVVAQTLDVSERSGRSALTLLEARGVLEAARPSVLSRGRPQRWWIAPEVLRLVPTAWQGTTTVSRGEQEQ